MTKKIIEYVREFEIAQAALAVVLADTEAALARRKDALNIRDKAKARLEEAQALVRTHYTAQHIDFGHSPTLALAAWAIWSTPMTSEQRGDAFRELGISSTMCRIDDSIRDRWHCVYSPSGTTIMVEEPARWSCEAQTHGGSLSEIVVNGCVLHQSA